MKELTEIRFNEETIHLKDNLVRGSILPQKSSELDRSIIFEGDSIVEGPVFGNRLEIRQGDLEVRGAVFAQLELHVDSSAKGNIIFMKSVASADTISSRAKDCKVIFHSDINAKSVALYNAFVAGSIYADEITLDNCVVIGGVFATHEIELNNTIIGTFNTPAIKASGTISLLLPSAFSIEKIQATAGTKLYNLSLADLGSLYKGVAQSENSGRIEMDINTDETKTTLFNEEVEKTIRSYSVVGKVLAVDLLDTDKFQNHFLLTAAALGPQLLKSYDLGVDSKGDAVTITIEKLRDFFFDILSGKIKVQDIDGNFDITQLTEKL